MDLGNGKACACPGPFHLPRPVGPARMTDGMMVVNALLVIFTAGLWLIPLGIHVLVAAFSNGNRIAESQAAWDRDHYGLEPNYKFPLPRP